MEGELVPETRMKREATGRICGTKPLSVDEADSWNPFQ